MNALVTINLVGDTLRFYVLQNPSDEMISRLEAACGVCINAVGNSAEIEEAANALLNEIAEREPVTLPITQEINRVYSIEFLL